MLSRSLYFVSFLILITSCQRIENKGKYVIEKTIAKSEEVTDKLITESKGIIKEYAFSDSYSKITSFDEEFVNKLNIEDIQGVRIELPFAFYYVFLKYKTDKDSLLSFIEHIQTKYEDISDTSFYKGDNEIVLDHILTVENDYNTIYPELAFFETYQKTSNLECYQCSRYPNVHYIIYDSITDIVYHHFERYWD